MLELIEILLPLFRILLSFHDLSLIPTKLHDIKSFIKIHGVPLNLDVCIDFPVELPEIENPRNPHAR